MILSNALLFPLNFARTHVSRKVSFSPVDTSLACICGNSIFRFYRVTEADLRPMTAPRVKEHNFLSHAWLKQPEDHLILGTETGQLLLFRSGEFVCYLVGAPGGQTKITALLPYSQGFVAGCSDGGMRLYVMDHADNPSPTKMFDCKQTWRVESTADVVRLIPCVKLQMASQAASRPENEWNPFIFIGMPDSISWTLQQQLLVLPFTCCYICSSTRVMTQVSLALCPNEDRLCAVTSDNQLFEVKIITQIIKDSDSKPVISLFHGPGLSAGGITGMDTCVRKPLVATCGMDRTIRVWNIMEQRLDLWKVFQEEPYSLAMHPSGLHLLVGFADKLRLMNILMDDIRACHEISIKQCREVKFSNGGSMFAAVNGNFVTIFDFNTYDKLADLRGHNSKVRHLYWGGQDQTLVSCGQDGAVYQWDVDEAKRLGEFVQKGTTYSCALSTKDSVFTVGNDRMLKELEIPDLQVVKELNAGVTLGQIVLSNSEHMMFAGTSEGGKPGGVRAYSFPLTGDYLEYACVGTPVTRLCITHDDQFLLVADEASCVFVFDVRDRQDRGQAGSKLGGVELQPLAASEPYGIADPTSIRQVFSDSERVHRGIRQEILATRSNLEDKNTLMVELKNKVDELALHNEYQLRLKDMNYSEKIKEITEKFTQDLEQSKNKFDLLREEKSDLEMEYESRLREMDDKHQHELQELENAYQQKIMGEVERYQALVQERNMQQDRWNEQQQLLATTHEKYVAELTEEFEQKLGEDRQLRLQLREEKNELDREFTETKHQVEDDIDTEIDNLRNRFEHHLTAEREATLRYKGENGIMKKKFTVLTKDIEDQKEEIRSLHEKEKDLQQKIKGLEREIAAHKREIKGKYLSLTVLVNPCTSPSLQLEKFKFVLDFKIKELKRQIEPRETEIGSMKEQIKEMDRELEQFHNSNAQLDLLIGELRVKLDEMQAQNLEQRKQIADQEASRSRLQRELHECVQYIQDPPALRARAAAMYNSNVDVDLPRNEMDANVIHEYHRHKVSYLTLGSFLLESLSFYHYLQNLLAAAREYLDSSLRYLHNKFVTDVDGHRTENIKVMQDNMLLIKEINMQRGHNKVTKRVLEAQVNMLKRFGASARHQEACVEHFPAVAVPSQHPETNDEPTSIIEKNKAIVADLRAQVSDLEGKVVSNRVYSREILPPMDGFHVE
ncbi:unnamed protein product [Scytosiphon promiscuus]